MFYSIKNRLALINITSLMDMKSLIHNKKAAPKRDRTLFGFDKV